VLNSKQILSSGDNRMDDPLLTAASRLGVATHTSAGPGHGPAGRDIWSSWPRPRMDIAHDALEEAIERDRTAGVVPAGSSNRWRAYAAGWCYEGEFIEAVASLALRVSSQARSKGAARATVRAPGTR
jgi:hypothetical protein